MKDIGLILKNNKYIVVGAIVIIVVFALIITFLFISLGKERAEKATLREKLAEVMKERKRLSDETEELKLIKSDLEDKFNGIEAQVDVLAENYEKERAQNDVVRLELTKKTEEFEKADEKMKAMADEKLVLQKMLGDEKTKYALLRERVDKLAGVKDVLEEKVRNIINKQGIELERIVVKADGELEGKIVVVNREYNFVVIDIGTEDDIELGNFLTVFRGGKFVGEVQVEKSYDTMSAATIITETKPRAIMVDDNVIVRSN